MARFGNTGGEGEECVLAEGLERGQGFAVDIAAGSADSESETAQRIILIRLKMESGKCARHSRGDR